MWSYRVVGEAPWQRACGSQPPAATWCAPESDNPLNGGDKWDLSGSGPNVFRIGHGRDKRTVVGVGEKSGVYIVLDARTGEFIWNTLVGPGGDMGGMEWGTAYDGDRIYVSITNQHHIQYLLTDNGKLMSTTATGGTWAALLTRTAARSSGSAPTRKRRLSGGIPLACGTSHRFRRRMALLMSRRWRRAVTSSMR